MRTILNFWQDFERRTIVADAGHLQRTELRRAFYAGVAAGFAAVAEGAITPETEGGGNAALDRLSAELARYMDAIRAGAA